MSETLIFSQPKHEVHVLNCLAGRAFHKIINAADYDKAIGSSINYGEHVAVVIANGVLRFGSTFGDMSKRSLVEEILVYFSDSEIGMFPKTRSIWI